MDLTSRQACFNVPLICWKNRRQNRRLRMKRWQPQVLLLDAGNVPQSPAGFCVLNSLNVFLPKWRHRTRPQPQTQTASDEDVHIICSWFSASAAAALRVDSQHVAGLMWNTGAGAQTATNGFSVLCQTRRMQKEPHLLCFDCAGRCLCVFMVGCFVTLLFFRETANNLTVKGSCSGVIRTIYTVAQGGGKKWLIFMYIYRIIQYSTYDMCSCCQMSWLMHPNRNKEPKQKPV